MKLKRFAALLLCLCLFAALLPGNQCAKIGAEPRNAVRVQVRERLRDRKKHGLVGVFRAPLRDGIEKAHGVEAVSEELRAQRLSMGGRKYVQNAAAQRELARALHKARAAVSRARERGGQVVQRIIRAAAERDGGGEKRLSGHRAEAQRIQTRHEHGRADLHEAVRNVAGAVEAACHACIRRLHDFLPRGNRVVGMLAVIAACFFCADPGFRDALAEIATAAPDIDRMI